jgi:hypothetical protein
MQWTKLKEGKEKGDCREREKVVKKMLKDGISPCVMQSHFTFMYLPQLLVARVK